MMNLKTHFKDFCSTQIEPLILNDEEVRLYSAYGNYLNGLESTLDSEKGIMPRGIIGCGKTIMFKMAQRYKPNSLRMVNTQSIVDNYEAGQSIDRYYKKEWVFDDLGTEQTANNYGKPTELLKGIIEIRYDLWKFQGVKTHFTTNLNNDALIEKYGERAYDRLKEMCIVFRYPCTESKRGKSTVKLIDSMEVQEKPKLSEEEINRLNDESIKTEISMSYELYLSAPFNICPNALNEKHYKFIKYCGLSTVTDAESAKLWALVNQSIKADSLKNKRAHQSIESYVKESNPRSIYAGRLIVECYKTWMNANKYTLEHVEGVMNMYSYTEMKSKQDGK